MSKMDIMSAETLIRIFSFVVEFLSALVDVVVTAGGAINFWYDFPGLMILQSNSSLRSKQSG